MLFQKPVDMTAFGTDVTVGAAVGPVHIEKGCRFGVQLCPPFVEFIVAADPALDAITVNDYFFRKYFVFRKEGHNLRSINIDLIVNRALKTRKDSNGKEKVKFPFCITISPGSRPIIPNFPNRIIKRPVNAIIPPVSKSIFPILTTSITPTALYKTHSTIGNVLYQLCSLG